METENDSTKYEINDSTPCISSSRRDKFFLCFRTGLLNKLCSKMLHLEIHVRSFLVTTDDTILGFQKGLFFCKNVVICFLIHTFPYTYVISSLGYYCFRSTMQVPSLSEGLEKFIIQDGGRGRGVLSLNNIYLA